MDEFEIEIKKEFLNEALVNLEETEESFMQLEGSSEPGPLLDKIFRLAHNLKGSSRAVGFGEVAEFTHHLENLVLQLKNGSIPLGKDVVTTLLRCNDRVVEMLLGLKDDLQAKFDCSDLLKDIEGWLKGTSVQSSDVKSESAVVPPVSESNAPELQKTDSLNFEGEALAPAPSAEMFFSAEETQTAAIKLNENPPTKDSQKAEAKFESNIDGAAKENKSENKRKEKDDEIVRVNLSRIDLLNDYVGELIVLQSVIQQRAVLNGPTPLQPALRQIMKLSKDIQTLSMSLRMLPIKPLVQKLQRVVRDTAQSLKKEVIFEITGDQLDVDKTVLDRMADPLVHMLRNAVDHGLESTEERLAAGKSREGRVKLSFSNEGNHLIIMVNDDGKGINAEVLRKKGIEKKLISPNDGLTEKDLVDLIFHPGFSTKTETSEISGRGVGMDVVKTNIEKSGGQVDVTTIVGKGSCFRVQIPLSLAVIDGLVVTSESNRYVIPLGQIQETINLRTHNVFKEKLGIGNCFELRGNVVPLFELEEVLGARGKTASNNQTAIVINTRGRLLGLVVKDVLRSQQIVIKPLTNGIKKQKGWIGSCVLGDGLPTLILNPVDLLEGRVNYQLDEQHVHRAAK